MKLYLILLALYLIASVYCDNLWNVDDRALGEAEEEAAKHQIIVYDKSMDKEEIDALKEKHEKECECKVDHLESVGAFVLTYDSANHKKISDLELDDTKEVGEEDSVAHMTGLMSRASSPTDPKFSQQWALQDLSNNADINIAEGWAEYLSDAKGKDPNGPSIVVAVIDTGIDYTHPDLKDQMWTNPGEIAGNGKDDDGNGIIDDVYGADFTQTTSGTGDPIDRNSHGTHCAGIIAAKENNGQGIAGVASFTQGKVKLMALKGLSDRGSGSTSGLLACLNYAIAKGAKISSNSWGGGSVHPSTERIWDAVLQNNPDHLFVAAAGNDNQEITATHKIMSCGLKEANQLCVASSTSGDSRSGFSNYGKDYVHVVAPGSSIMSTIPGGKYASYSGTSMACPQVSGFAALIRTMRPDLNGQQVRAVIESNVRVKSEYANLVSSSGLIDVGKTLKALKSGSGGGGCQHTQVTVKTTTKDWGYENSWTLGSCSSSGQFENHKTVSQTCCLAKGTYTLECKDTYGDGWHGGFVKINGKKYCGKFKNGHKTTKSVTI